MNSQKLPLRKGVGVLILNDENKIFVGKRKDNPKDNWQMPQGGVDTGEDYFTAMKRELFEETSIENIKVLKELEGFFEYELPKHLLGKIWKGRFRGQRQKWFIAKFTGKLSEINIKSITVPLGEIKIQRKIKNLLIIFRSFTNENKLLSQNKKRI